MIYVATHGTPRTTDTAGGANYLITYDTEVYNGGSLDEDALYATAYPMVELADAVSTRMKALRTAVFLDTCYSGGRGRAAQPLQPRSPTPRPRRHARAHADGTGRIVMAASEVNEESLESSQLHHGYFTYYLLQALKSGKGETPLSQVYSLGRAAGFAKRLLSGHAPAPRNEPQLRGRGLRPPHSSRRDRQRPALTASQNSPQPKPATASPP